MGLAVRPGELDLATPVHRHHAGEAVLAGDRVDRLGQGVLGAHQRSVLPRGRALDRITLPVQGRYRTVTYREGFGV
jgi:hypothetical protein